MHTGQKLRLRGDAGALFVVTVGHVFTEADITKRLATGEWSLVDENPTPSTSQGDEQAPGTPTAKPDPNRPAVGAPKAVWIDYVVRRGLLSRDDAINYTKVDLIEMSS
jgi:hypothetical protein